MEINRPPGVDIQKVAITFGLFSAILSGLVFIACRSDGDMKMLALGNVLGSTSQLIAIASTLLVGRATTGHLPDTPSGPIPPGATITSTTSTAVQTDPKS